VEENSTGLQIVAEATQLGRSPLTLPSSFNIYHPTKLDTFASLCATIHFAIIFICRFPMDSEIRQLNKMIHSVYELDLAQIVICIIYTSARVMVYGVLYKFAGAHSWLGSDHECDACVGCK